MRSAFRTALCGLGLGLLLGCSEARSELRLATTPAIEASGFFERVLPAFSERTGRHVAVLTVSSAQALSLAASGDVDVVLVDSLTDEQAFLARGHGSRPAPLLRLRYQLLGPAGDPAHVRGKPVAEALRSIAEAGCPFVGQSLRSGIDRREKDLWVKAGVSPHGHWYHQVGGESDTALQVADAAAAYVLAEPVAVSRFQAKGTLRLVPLVETDPALETTVVLLPVARPANGEAVAALAAYLASPRAALGMARSGLQHVREATGSDLQPDPRQRR